MCNRKEIQENHQLGNGDLIAAKKDNDYFPPIFHCNNCTDEMDKEIGWVWLPRQDQLQDMIDNYELYMYKRKDGNYGAMIESYGIPEWTATTNTPEQILLELFMKKKHQAKWTGTKWEKELENELKE